VRSFRFSITPRLAAGQRIPAIDELKGLALVLVLLYHGGGVLGAPNVIHGEIGVDIFLILSGLALAVNSADLPLRQFLKRRFLRIYPSYWIALGLFLWMHARYLGVVRPWSSVAQHVVGVHGFTGPEYITDIVDAYWFISLIVFSYVAFACIRRRLDDLSLVVAVTGVLTVLATLLFQRQGNASGLAHLSLRFPSFFVGVIAGRLLGAGTAEIRLNLSLGIGLLCFYFLTFFLSAPNTYTLPAVGIIVAWVGLRPLVVRLPAGRAFLGALAFSGLISYEVYLFHAPLIRDYNLYYWHVMAHNLAPTRGQIMEGMLVALGITLVLSIAVHFLVGWLFSVLRSREIKGHDPTSGPVGPPGVMPVG